MKKMNAKQLRGANEKLAHAAAADIVRQPVYLILENIYDTYNIGGLFRLADALAVTKLFICGESEIPPNSRIKKASIGTYKVVPWEYAERAGDVVLMLKQNGVQTIAVEQHESAVDYRVASYRKPVAFVVGNETYGVSSDTISLCDLTVEIPQWGINRSLNVIVSAAIVSYFAVAQLSHEGSF